MKKIIIAASTLLLLTGLIFTALPHDLHNSALGLLTFETTMHEHEHDEHGSHDLHQWAGLATVLLGLAGILIGRSIQ